MVYYTQYQLQFGNLQDITLRAINVLQNVDYILCEDTRISIKLLNHLNINKQLISFNKDNEHIKYKDIIEDLINNKKIALISDAGTPGISDPGHILINTCIKNNIQTQVLPGPTAFVPALVNSGFDTTHFNFKRFLKNRNEVDRLYRELLGKKLLDFYKQTAKVNKKTVTFKEFEEIEFSK